jgi:hypothetical protein
MAKPLYLALLFGAVLTDPAAAQSSGIAGTSAATPYGAVALPATTATPSTAAAGPVSSAASPSAAGGPGAVSAGSTTSAAPSGSGGSSTARATASSNNVPNWLLCPPSGASGMAPFLTGTNLSCAP